MGEAGVVVVGGGLAGLHAALESARLGLRCTAFCGASPGGLLLSIDSVQDLPDYPGGIAGYDLGPMTQEAALDAGVTCLSTEAEHIDRDGDAWRVSGGGDAVRARALILAPGSRLRALDVPGEERLFGKGVSHCASCDAPMLRGRAVAVVGGGDAACQEALTVASHAGRVQLLVRGPAWRARRQWQERIAAQPNITVRHGAVVDEILGETTVTGVRLAGGETLAVDAVFVYPGLAPHTAWLGTLVPRDPAGRIVVDADLCTPVAGVFAAGSARSASSGQAAEAAHDGTVAARSAHRYLETRC